MSRRRGDEKDSRLSSKVEIPERHRSRERISPEQQQQGTKTRNYNYKSRDYSRTSPRYDEYDHRNSTGKFLDREYNNNRNGKINEPEGDESDEELKGLSYEEYRTTKRIKLRKNIRNCIYRITPSPPRSEWDLQEEDENEGDIEIEGDGKEQVGKGLSSSDGDDESESDEDMREKKKKRRRKSSKKSKRRNDSESDESDESESDTDRRRKRKSGSKKRGSVKKRSNWRSKKSKKRSSRVDSDESESEDIESDKSESGSADDNARTKNRRSSSYASHSKSKVRKKKRSESVSEGSEKSLLDYDTDKKIIEMDDDGLKAEMNSEALAFKEMLELQKKSGLESDAVVGPMPLPRAEGHISYGGALRPGEGDAIARHQRMNAIQYRKGKPSLQCEDKRALAMFNYEEKAKRVNTRLWLICKGWFNAILGRMLALPTILLGEKPLMMLIPDLHGCET
ncbi:hypothetical protein IFM89_036851 [Coptis chinensis]|uniref:NF-kappa-B-activating protein C-terminal domain-containing protein n=1 Tax=Coptis chinensis TaxID=261450 RepID=A0A835LLI4_9MAGN|nr:hypothetical protein IFM89_036851 [Coptis chinensis]